MLLDSLIAVARREGASDVHCEPGMPAALRVRGRLKLVGEPLPAAQLQAAARELLTGERWEAFTRRQSFDLSKPVQGVRCRINVLRTSRGVGFAIRLLTSFHATLKKLNLHPSLANVLARGHGLVLICGPTGSGKSTTLAALLQEINLAETQHIITIEQPIEYALVPRKSFIRQREVGRDTPSVEQALIDALREDPDVLMVGELREPETMRLTLNASETGHLVLATLHSSTCVEGLQRLVGAFAPSAQPSVCAQLADALVACVAQRLTFREDVQIAVPECEILMANVAARAAIRQGNFSQLQTVIDTSAADGSYSFTRYRAWLDHHRDLHVPRPTDTELASDEPLAAEAAPVLAAEAPRRAEAPRARPAPAAAAAAAPPTGVLEISGDEEDPAAILSQLERRKP
jgi:twitching motility protein PilT